MPRVTPPPMRIFRSAWMESRCTASVFTTTVRAPWMPIRWRRWTELPPAPPHPITRTRGRASVNESRNDWFPVRCAVSRPIRDLIPGGPRWRPPLPARLRGRAFPAISLAVGPFHGLVEPPADVLSDRVADRVLHGHGVARLDELLKVHHVSFRQFDHELADVIRRELDVDETVDRGANRIGDRRERTAFHELMEGFHFVRRQPDGDPLRFRWHRPPPQFGFLSDIRMTITLFKHMSTRLSKVRAPTPGGRARTGWRSAARTNLEGSHPIVFRVVFDLGEMQGLQHGRDVHPESPAKTLLQSIPPTDGILRESTPRFDGPVRGWLLLVGASEGHPVSARLEHLVQVVDASEVVPELRAPRLDDERGRIKSLVAERLKFRCPNRRLQVPRMFARALTGLAFARHPEIPRLIRVRCPRMPLARCGSRRAKNRWIAISTIRRLQVTGIMEEITLSGGDLPAHDSPKIERHGRASP